MIACLRRSARIALKSQKRTFDGAGRAPSPAAPPIRHRSIRKLLMRAAARLLAILILAAASSAVAQQKHLIDPTPRGSLNPVPLPPLRNPDAPSTPAKELFARKSTPFPGPPRHGLVIGDPVAIERRIARPPAEFVAEV